jgi:hypothetical protein
LLCGYRNDAELLASCAEQYSTRDCSRFDASKAARAPATT